MRGYNAVTRRVVKNTLTVDKSLRMIIDHSPDGLMFTSGNAVDMLLRLSSGHILAQAIVNWNNHCKEDLEQVPSLIKSYLSQVVRSDWERHPWASEVISLVWYRYDRQVETFQARTGILQDMCWHEKTPLIRS